MKKIHEIYTGKQLPLAADSTHDLTNNIPPEVKTLVDAVFESLKGIKPGWRQAWKNPENMNKGKIEWVKAFYENGINDMAKVQRGMIAARKSETDFWPSCGRFVSWCNFDDRFPSAEEAMQLCIRHRSNMKMFKPEPMSTRGVIIELCKKVDWLLIGNRPAKDGLKHFEGIYAALLSSDYEEPVAQEFGLLPTKEQVDDNMSEQQKADKRKRALDRIREIKRKIK